MENINECFQVKKDGKIYCRCRISFSAEEEAEKASLFAKKLLDSFRSTCERMSEYDREGEKELRSRFNIVPYSCEGIFTVFRLGKVLSAVNTEYSLTARFPGGKSFSFSRCVLIDEDEDLCLSPQAVGCLLFGKKADKLNICEIFADGRALFFYMNEECLKIEAQKLEESYISVMKNKKRAKAIDNEGKM